MTSASSALITLTELTEKGDGVGLLDGRKIFVSGGLPGEQVSVRLHGIKPAYAQGELLTVVTPSADRIANFCPHTECGGCQLGVMNYPAQLRLKRERTVAALARHQLTAEVKACVGMERPFAYRNKMLYAVQPSAEGLELGFYRKASHTLIACDDCAIQPELSQQLVAMVRQWARECGVEPYDEQQHRGQLRYLMLLLLLIGIQMRNSGMRLRQILLNPWGMKIALTVILSSWLGSLLAAQLLGMPFAHGLAMSSSFGWYSLSGILVADKLGPVLGSAAFINDLGRELIAILIIPVLMRRHPSAAIGYGGATALDFTLPVIQKSGGIQVVPVAIVSGFILSLLGPILILGFLAI